MKLSHFDATMQPHMVDVSSKNTNARIATARGLLKPSDGFFKNLAKNLLPKGDPWPVAKIAGIQAAKKTAELIPLCHNLFLSQIDLGINYHQPSETIRLECLVRTEAKTGAEMEALVGITIAALTFYDMVKAVDPKMQLGPFGLYKKEGGASGLVYNPVLDWQD